MQMTEAFASAVAVIGPGFVRQVLTELEGAVERASDTRAEKKPAVAAEAGLPSHRTQAERPRRAAIRAGITSPRSPTTA